MDSSTAVDHTPKLGRKEALTALAAALLLACAVLWPLLVDGRVPIPADAVDRVEPWRSEAPAPLADGPLWNPLITDSLWQVVPEGIAAYRLWSEGLPLWDPNPACGVPALAQGRMYSNPIYTVTARIVGPLAAIGWTALAQLTVALWGAYLLGRQIGVVPAAAAVTAVSFGLNLYLILWLPHTSFFGAMVWLPWIFFAYERAVAMHRPVWKAIGAVAFAVQLLEGHIATPFFGAVTLGLWSVVRGAAAARVEGRAGAAIRPIATAAALLIIGAMLVAPQILATGELYFESARGAAVGRATFIDFEQGLRIIAPWLWGHRFQGGTYVGPINVAELGLYFGVVPLALIAVAVLGRRRLEGRFYAVAAVICGLVVFDIPPVRWLMGVIIPIIYQSFPGRIFAVAALSGAVAAGLGTNWLLTEATRRRRLRWAGAVLAAAAVVWLGAAWIAFVHWPAANEAHTGLGWIDWLEGTRVEGLVWAGSWLAMAAVAVWRLRHTAGRRSWLCWAPAAIAALDLLHVGAWTVPFFEQSAVLQSTPTTVRLSALTASSRRQGRIVPVPSQQVIPGQVPSVFGLPSVSAYSSWPLARYDSYASATGQRYLSWPYIYFDRCCGEAMNALAGRWIVAPADLDPRTLSGRSDLRLVRDGAVRIWDNPGALDRARVVGGVRWVRPGDHDAVLRVLASRGFREDAEVVLENRRSGPEIGPAAAGVGSAVIVSDDPTRIEVEVVADRPAALVLADSWYPGWEVTIDGRPGEIFPANLALRGVPVPGGRSTVVFRYRPRWLAPGIVLSLIGFALLVVQLRTGRRRPPFVKVTSHSVTSP